MRRKLLVAVTAALLLASASAGFAQPELPSWTVRLYGMNESRRQAWFGARYSLSESTGWRAEPEGDYFLELTRFDESALKHLEKDATSLKTIRMRGLSGTVDARWERGIGPELDLAADIKNDGYVIIDFELRIYGEHLDLELGYTGRLSSSLRIPPQKFIMLEVSDTKIYKPLTTDGFDTVVALLKFEPGRRTDAWFLD